MPTLSNELDDIDHIQIKLVDQFITLENKLRHKEIDVETMFKMSRQYHQDAHKDILAIIATQNTALLKEVADTVIGADEFPVDQDEWHGEEEAKIIGADELRAVQRSKLAAMGGQ